jgi:hypothetical protein
MDAELESIIDQSKIIEMINRLFSLPAVAVSAGYYFFFLLPGYGDCLAVFKENIRRQTEPQFCVHNAGNFHAFYHPAAG